VDIDILLGSAVIAAIFSGLVSYIISRRQGSLQYITGERKEWREKIREIAYKLDGASYKDTLKILTELKVRINAFGNNKVLVKYSDDAHIWKIINELENEKPSKEVLAMKQKQLIEYLSLLLKFDWERSKKEVKGNIYDIASLLMFLCTGVYFAVSIFICNQNADITRFELASIVGVYILVLVICNITFIVEVKYTCIGILKGVITAYPKQYSCRRLMGCYILWAISAGVLFIIYVFAIVKVFALLGNGKASEMSIVLLTIIYLFGIGLQYISQTLNVDKEYYYVCAIEKIRFNCEEKEEELKIMAVIPQKKEKFNAVYEMMVDKTDIDEFKQKFKETYPDDWDKINKEFKKEERQDKKGKGHPMPNPEQYLVNMYKVGCKKHISK